MENKELCGNGEIASGQSLAEDALENVSGGHSHARSHVFRARRPGGGLSSYKCELCDQVLPDAGAYFEHKKMVHGA